MRALRESRLNKCNGETSQQLRYKNVTLLTDFKMQIKFSRKWKSVGLINRHSWKMRFVNNTAAALHFIREQKNFFIDLTSMAESDEDSVHSGDSSVLLCIGTPLLGSLTNLDGFGRIRGGCTNPVHNCPCYVRFEYQLSFACLNCHGLCPAFSHVS